MHTYEQYCPVAKATEILAEPWTPLIIRELLFGVSHFNEFGRCLPGISRSLLAQRLRSLERAGIVERRVGASGPATSYHLTRAGQELEPVIASFGEWGARWLLGDPELAELDPSWLVWIMQRFVNIEALPPRRVVVQLDFLGARMGRFWLILEPTEVDVCLKDPGFEVDVFVTGDIAAFYRVHAGRISLDEAIRNGEVQLQGTPRLLRAFPRWFNPSPFAGVARGAAAER